MFVSKGDGQTTTTLKEACEVLNNEFQRVFVESTHSDQILLAHDSYQGRKLTDVVICPNEVKKLLKTLNARSAAGPDGVHPRVLQECADLLSEPLAIIFDCCLQIGIVPADWKKGNITPVFKKGTKTDPLNYRPINLISVVCKVIEKLIESSVTEHLEATHLLSPHQHGFR